MLYPTVALLVYVVSAASCGNIFCLKILVARHYDIGLYELINRLPGHGADFAYLALQRTCKFTIACAENSRGGIPTDFSLYCRAHEELQNAFLD